MVVIFGVAYFSQGALLDVEDWQAALFGAIALGLVNTLIRPIIKLFTLPLNLVTLGLFSLVINTLMLYLVSWIVPGLDTVGILSTFVAALIISIITTILYWFIDRD
jgi:putative membrane protein